jgi:hypothetical protein
MGFLTGERNDGETLPDETPMMAVPGFAAPPPLRMDPPSDPPSGHQLDGDAEAAAGSDGLPPMETSAPKPVRPKLVDTAAAEAFGKAAGGAFVAVGGVLNAKFGAHEDDDVWIPTEQERDQVGQPLGRIMARHAPLPGGEQNATDIADGIAIAIGLVQYALRNIGKRARRTQPPPPQQIPADTPTPAPYGEHQS